MTRRTLLSATGVALAGWSLPTRAARRAKVVIVGGGFAGSSCAITLKQALPEIEVVVLDERPHAITGPMSNALLVGLREAAATTRRLAGLAALGIRHVPARVSAIDVQRLRVQDDEGRWHSGDRLILATGIGFKWGQIEGLDAASSPSMPHAWLGDASVQAFRERFAALRDGATLVIVAPPNPYRCPPGPYERASLCAWALSRLGKRSKILIADAKDDFSKRGLFQFAWDTQHPGMLEWIPRAAGGNVVAIDAKRSSLTLANGERITADLICAIPAQRAAESCLAADLVDASGWCPVDAADFQSLRHPHVHVIGDAAMSHPMPKSAFSANSQAKLCALAIAASLSGREAPVPRLINTCYSLIAPDQAISVSGLYGLAGDRLSALAEGMSPLVADAALRRREAVDARHWYHSIMADSFNQHITG